MTSSRSKPTFRLELGGRCDWRVRTWRQFIFVVDEFYCDLMRVRVMGWEAREQRLDLFYYDDPPMELNAGSRSRRGLKRADADVHHGGQTRVIE